MTEATSAILNLEQVTVLYRLGKLVRASLDLHSKLAAIADAACELTQAELRAIHARRYRTSRACATDDLEVAG